MAGAAAAAAPPEMALPAADDPEYEEECSICRLPAQAGRPLRRPCACRGSIRFVHDHCQFRWLATRQQSQSQCEVCKHDISTCPLYATGTPARLPVSEFMVSLPKKLMGFMIPLYITVWTIWEFAIPVTTLWTWRLAFARTYAQVHHLLSICFSSTSILADVVLCLAMPFLEAPSACRVPGLGRRAQGRHFRFFGVQAHTLLLAAGAPLMVVMVDMYLACIFGLLPFSLGRIILWSRLCHSFGNLDVVDSYTSTASILLIGYGFISMVGATFGVLHTSYKYLRGERLVIAIFLGRLPGILFRGIISSITIANIFLNLLIKVIIYPLLFGWSLDICTAKMFGATMSQRLNLLTASSFASTAFHCLIGRTFLNLRPRLSRTIQKILRPGVNIPFLHHDVREPFYKFCSKKLLCLFVDTIFVSLVVLVPINIADRLAPEVFPLDITYFSHPVNGTPIWRGPQNCVLSLSALLHVRFLSVTVTFYLEWLAGTVIRYWFVAAGQALRNNIAPKGQYGSSSEANDKRKSVAIRTMLRMVLEWLTAVIFNSTMLFFSILVGRAMLLFTIPHLPVAAGGLKFNDLFATAVGFCIISAIIAAARYLFACMTSRGTWLLALKMLLLVLTWMVIIPLLIGLLVDLLLISPFIGPDNDFPVLDFFCIWSLGSLLKKLWIKLAHCTAFEPFLAYFIDERWEGRLKQAKVYWSSRAIPLCWFFQGMFMPMAMKLLTALGGPYVLAKGIFPRFGYSAAVNSTVYRFAWLGNLGFCALCYLGKVLCVQLHDSIRDDRYIIGQRLKDVGDGS